MKQLTLLLNILLIFNVSLSGQNKALTTQEKAVIIHKGTELPYSGKYYNYTEKGVYACKQCGEHLYSSEDKFSAHCGWPSFDDEIKGSVKRVLDRDGKRTEIICTKCDAHLGHVFLDEGFTNKNTRHCVNSISLEFIPANKKQEVAIFAGGCFWGIEYLMESQEGVISAESGYIGGLTPQPTYQLVTSKTTNYAEAVKIVFNPSVITYKTLAKLFFEIHDPTQVDGQGPDLGKQYRSEVFYTNEKQKDIAKSLIKILEKKGYVIATRVSDAGVFYKAEEYHQNFYTRKKSTPYCHKYTKRF